MMKPETHNIFANIPAIIPEELFECLIERKRLKIERIVTQGQATAKGEWFDQSWDEWVLLLQGGAILGYEDGQTVNLQAGDYFHIPAHVRHRVEWTQPETNTVWLAIHFEP